MIIRRLATSISLTVLDMTTSWKFTPHDDAYHNTTEGI